jgi:hypothetical protein
MSERLRPETVAVTLAQHAHDTEPEPQTYLARVVGDLFFADLTEDLYRRGQRDAAKAVLEVQTDWNREA